MMAICGLLRCICDNTLVSGLIIVVNYLCGE